MKSLIVVSVGSSLNCVDPSVDVVEEQAEEKLHFGFIPHRSLRGGAANFVVSQNPN